MAGVNAKTKAYIDARFATLERDLPGLIAYALSVRKPAAGVSIGYGTVVAVNDSGTVDVALDVDAGLGVPAAATECNTTTAVGPADRVQVLFVPPAGAVVLGPV